MDLFLAQGAADHQKPVPKTVPHSGGENWPLHNNEDWTLNLQH